MSKRPQAEYDVFISYSSKDKTWVREQLLQRVEQAGLKAFIDFRDFRRGAPSVSEIERGLVNSRKTLLVLTQNYNKSSWTELESLLLQTLDPANRDLRLIPLLKAKCELPLRIKYLTCIDFRNGADLDLAWRQLMTALEAPPEPVLLGQSTPDQWFLADPYPMPSNFTGRMKEREILSSWLNGDAAHPLLVLRALGGFGKSALTWHWLNLDVDRVAWPHVVWWSFYERDASFETFLWSTLDYLAKHRRSARSLPLRDQISKLLDLLHKRGTLLILDGFERALRAFGGLDAAYQGDEPNESVHRGPQPRITERDCQSPLAEVFLRGIATLPGIQAKALLTTRLRPAVLEAHGGDLLQGCREVELKQLSPTDAVEFFRAHGIRGGRAEIESACSPYGYHPLSLRLLAGLIVRDPRQPGDVAAAQCLDVSGDLRRRQHHVLEQTFSSLVPARRALLTRIACFRSAVAYEALKALAEASGTDGTLDSDLRDLVSRGLLQHDIDTRRFDLHPIVRRYTYDKQAVGDRATTHDSLRDYFAGVMSPEKVNSPQDLGTVIELFHHTIRAGRYTEAEKLFRDRLERPTYFQFAAYQLRIDLLHAFFPDGEDLPPRLHSESASAWILNALANSYSSSGQPHRAIRLFEQHNEIATKAADKRNLAVGLINLAYDQVRIGALRTAETNLRHSVSLSHKSGQTLCEAIGLSEAGRALAYRGAWNKSRTELRKSLEILEDSSCLVGQGLTYAYLALLQMLRLRSMAGRGDLRSPISEETSPVGFAKRALALADEWGRTRYSIEREQVRGHWMLGAAYRVIGELDEAEGHLNEALARCRRINLVDHEADILIDFGRLRNVMGANDEAKRLVEEALTIAQRSAYPLQSADAHLVLAHLALAPGNTSAARQHATEAYRLAYCDGAPEYTYKVAYEEAATLLTHLHSPAPAIQ